MVGLAELDRPGLTAPVPALLAGEVGALEAQIEALSGVGEQLVELRCRRAALDAEEEQVRGRGGGKGGEGGEEQVW